MPKLIVQEGEALVLLKAIYWAIELSMEHISFELDCKTASFTRTCLFQLFHEKKNHFLEHNFKINHSLILSSSTSLNFTYFITLKQFLGYLLKLFEKTSSKSG